MFYLDNKIGRFGGRQIRPTFARQTTDFCWPILLTDEIGQLYRSSDIRFTVVHTLQCHDNIVKIAQIKLKTEMISLAGKRQA